jgi:hypothetical protein
MLDDDPETRYRKEEPEYRKDDRVVGESVDT